MQKLPYPYTDKTPVEVILTDGINRDGKPKEVFRYIGSCTFSEKAKYTRNPDGKLIQLEGAIYIGKDIAPTQNLIEGSVIISNREYKIYKSSRPRNPDGSVHHTKLELI